MEWFAAIRRPTIWGCRVGNSGCCMQLLTDICNASSRSFTWSLLSYTKYLHGCSSQQTFTIMKSLHVGRCCMRASCSVVNARVTVVRTATTCATKSFTPLHRHAYRHDCIYDTRRVCIRAVHSCRHQSVNIATPLHMCSAQNRFVALHCRTGTTS